MSSSKSKIKGKRKKIFRKFKAELKQKALTRDLPLRVNPAGQEKMSEVLSRFVEPYARYATSEEDYQRLYSVATLAWNAALVSETELPTLDALIHRFMPAAEDDAKLIIDELIHRKRKYFSQYSRMILHYDVEMIGDDVHLTVASTVM